MSKLWGVPGTGECTSSLILTLSHWPLASSVESLPFLHLESYLTSRVSGRVEWSRMIREERFFGKMVEKVTSVQEYAKPRGYGVAGQEKEPETTTGQDLSCLGWFWKCR